MSDDFFDSLNAEIAAEVAKSNRAKDLEKHRKAANNRFATKEQRTMSKLEYERLKAALDAEQWGTECYYAMFSEQICDGCGSVHRTFLQYMAKQFAITNQSAQRFYPVTKPEFSDLPRRVMIQPLTTHVCADCCADHGFDFEETDRMVLKPRKGGISVNPNYEAEDING